jgi:hypothetical protein
MAKIMFHFLKRDARRLAVIPLGFFIFIKGAAFAFFSVSRWPAALAAD